jgi:peptide/nickel transport system permease protein
MRRFLLRRLGHAVVVVWGVVTAVFFLVRLTGDPAAFLVDQAATREEVAEVQRRLGLDRPWLVQYLDFLTAVPRGDFGTSIRERRPALGMVFQHFWPATVELAAAAIVLSTALAIPLGIVSATRKDRAADHVSRIASLVLQSMPGFWLGLMLILLFAVELKGWLPAYGSGSLRHLILPAIALSAAPLAQNVRLIRAGMLEVLQQDYVRTARAKGLSGRLVISLHALPNALLPVITLSGILLGLVLAGSIPVERAFGTPGLGYAMFTAVSERDVFVMQNLVFLYAVVFVLLNIFVDVVIAWLDPRIRYQ